MPLDAIFLDRVDPSPIPPLSVTLVDMLTVSKAIDDAATAILNEILAREVLGVVRPGTELCGLAQQEKHITDQFQAFLDVDPSGTFDAFEAQLGDDRYPDDSECDLRLPLLGWAVIVDATGETIGRWDMYNLFVKRQTPVIQFVSAMQMPGVEPAPGHSYEDTLVEIMRHVMATSFTFAASGTPSHRLDFVAHRFPQRLEHQWKNAINVRGMNIDDVLTRVAIGRVFTKGPGDVPIQMSRTGVTPPGRP